MTFFYPCQLKVLTLPKRELVGLQHLESKAFRPLEQLYLELVHRTKKLIIREILRLPHKREPVVFHWNLGIEPIHLKATNVPFAQKNKQKRSKSLIISLNKRSLKYTYTGYNIK